MTSAQNNTGIDELFKELGKKFLTLNHSGIESDIQKQEPKQNIKLDENNVAKKNEEQKKKKKNPC